MVSSDGKSDKPNGDGQSDDSSQKEGSVVTVGILSMPMVICWIKIITSLSRNGARMACKFETVDDDERC